MCIASRFQHISVKLQTTRGCWKFEASGPENPEETDQFFPKKKWGNLDPSSWAFPRSVRIPDLIIVSICWVPSTFVEYWISWIFCGRFHQFVVLVIFTNTSNDIGSHFSKPPSLEKKVGSYIDEYCGDGCIETVDLLIRGKGVLSIWFALMTD